MRRRRRRSFMRRRLHRRSFTPRRRRRRRSFTRRRRRLLSFMCLPLRLRRRSFMRHRRHRRRRFTRRRHRRQSFGRRQRRGMRRPAEGPVCRHARSKSQRRMRSGRIAWAQPPGDRAILRRPMDLSDAAHAEDEDGTGRLSSLLSPVTGTTPRAKNRARRPA